MFDWIWNNKDWLFSGGGVAIIIFGGRWIIKKIKGRKTPEPSLNGASLQDIIDAPPPQKREPNIIATSLSPGKIFKEIKSVPLLMQQDVCKQYEGIQVSWKGSLILAKKIDEEMVQIIIRVTEEKVSTKVSFDVDPKQYAGIGLLREGHEILVEGKINEFWLDMIFLKAENLVFNIDSSV